MGRCCAARHPSCMWQFQQCTLQLNARICSRSTFSCIMCMQNTAEHCQYEMTSGCQTNPHHKKGTTVDLEHNFPSQGAYELGYTAGWCTCSAAGLVVALMRLGGEGSSAAAAVLSPAVPPVSLALRLVTFSLAACSARFAAWHSCQGPLICCKHQTVLQIFAQLSQHLSAR